MLNRLDQGKNSTSTILANFVTFFLLHLIYISLYRHYDFSDFRPPNKKEVGVMWDNSPIAHLEHVKAPTLIALGLKDRRVPPSQGQFLPFPLPIFLEIYSQTGIFQESSIIMLFAQRGCQRSCCYTMIATMLLILL